MLTQLHQWEIRNSWAQSIANQKLYFLQLSDRIRNKVYKYLSSLSKPEYKFNKYSCIRSYLNPHHGECINRYRC